MYAHIRLSRLIAVVLGILVLLLAIAVGIQMEHIPVVSPIEPTYKNIRKVIIDPGHGGEDGGAQVGKYVEKSINLSISLKLRDELTARGYQAILTRETDVSIYDPGTTTLRRKKTSDLYNRLDIIKANPDAMFVSIHLNKFSSSSERGAQVFYGRLNPQSQLLAQTMQTALKQNVSYSNKRKIQKGGRNLFLLYNAKIPAILVECGFMSNPGEMSNLNNAAYQGLLARTIANGIDEYNALNNPD